MMAKSGMASDCTCTYVEHDSLEFEMEVQGHDNILAGLLCFSFEKKKKTRVFFLKKTL